MDNGYKIWYLEFDNQHYIYFFKSPRGGAKSYSMMDYCINEFIENFNMFYWIRRKESEILNELPKLIPNKLLEKYEIIKFKCEKGSVLVSFDNKNYICIGFYGAITTFKKGQRNFNQVKTIIFDEYNDTCDLVTNERFKFWNAIATITDTRNDYKIVFLGNESIYYSPYEYLIDRDITKVVEINELDTRYIGTPLYEAVKGTDVGSYMFESNYFKNFKYFFDEEKFKKIPKEIIITYNYINFYYYKNNDIIITEISNKKGCSLDEFLNIEKQLKKYYNLDKFYYLNKETYKKVSQYLPEYIK